MKLLLYHTLTLDSRLTPDEIYGRLQYYVTKRENMLISFTKKLPQHTFEGNYDDESFRIRKIIHYRNSFLPILHGTYWRNGTHTRIQIKMRLLPFLYIIFPLMVAIAIGSFFQLKSSKPNATLPELALPIIILFIIYFLILGFFIFEVWRAKKDMLRLFEAEEVNVH